MSSSKDSMLTLNESAGNEDANNTRSMQSVELDKLNEDLHTDDCISKIKKQRQAMLETLQNLENQIKPLEFESYADYYLISKFRVGKSASGRVNVDGLRSRRNGGPYRRQKRSSQRASSTSRAGSKPLSSESEKDEESDQDRSSNGQQKASDVDYKPSNTWKINRDITTDSIITEDNSGPVRRSSRLTRKEKKKKLKKETKFHKETKSSGKASSPEFKHAIIQDLYENLVNKVSDPVRRSDWLLPPKRRYIPEKNQPVKHEPEQIKINELAKNLRIKKILSRFDGGLAGVRTST